jgi:hypothetical protein
VPFRDRLPETKTTLRISCRREIAIVTAAVHRRKEQRSIGAAIKLCEKEFARHAEGAESAGASNLFDLSGSSAEQVRTDDQPTCPAAVTLGSGQKRPSSGMLSSAPQALQ